MDSEYVAELCDGILIDAEKQGTEARFINDFHVGRSPLGLHVFSNRACIRVYPLLRPLVMMKPILAGDGQESKRALSEAC